MRNAREYFYVLLLLIVHLLLSDKRYVNWTLKIASVHGKQAPLPFIKSVEVS